jgi:nucleolar complex protein 2
MGKKAGHKATKKFAKSGQLKKTIQARHKHRNVKKRVERQKARVATREKEASGAHEEDEREEESGDESEMDVVQSGKGKKSK